MTRALGQRAPAVSPASAVLQSMRSVVEQTHATHHTTPTHHTKMQTALPSSSAVSSRAARRFCARNAERLRSRVLGVPQRPVRGLAKCSAQAIVSALALQGARGSQLGGQGGMLGRVQPHPHASGPLSTASDVSWLPPPSITTTLHCLAPPPKQPAALHAALWRHKNHNGWCSGAAQPLHGHTQQGQQHARVRGLCRCAALGRSAGASCSTMRIQYISICVSH